jgi:hypothetical protein
MKKTFLALFVFLLLSLIGGLYWIDREFKALVPDEDQILRETQSAYEQVAFRREPFTKGKEITALAAFLLRHLDEIKDYNRHEEWRNIPLSEGRWTGYKNAGDCFEMPTFYRAFVTAYIPPVLVDSFYHFSADISNNLITNLTICGCGYEGNVYPQYGSVLFHLPREKRKPGGSCYIQHTLSLNRKLKRKNTLTSIYDCGLTKDTVLTGEMKYEILVSPYTGL